jgi:thiol-disulfide isomerase/thioredoxin
MLRDITPKQYEELIDFGGTGLVVLGSESCTICQSMKPVFEQVLDQTNINVVKLDAIEYKEYIENEMFITTMPVFMLVENGKVIGQLEGEQTTDDLIKFLKKIIK